MRACDLFVKKPLKEYRKSINPPYSHRDFIPIFATLFIIFVIPVTVFAVLNFRNLNSKAAAPNLADLGVTYIERTPRYARYDICYNPSPYLCGGQTANDKRWPARGDLVTFTGHVKNHGSLTAVPVSYTWYLDNNSVGSGTLPQLSPGQEIPVSYQWVWDHDVVNGKLSGEHKIRLVVDTGNLLTEITKNNNVLENYTNALAFRFHVENSTYNYFKNYMNGLGSYNWEDWAQYQIRYFMQMFADAGINERLRIDQIVMESDNSLPNGGTHAPVNWDWDGSWGFTVGVISMYQGNPALVSGPDPEWSLIHELGHQIGLVDGYNLDIQGSEVGIRDQNGNLVAGTSVMPYVAWDVVRYGGCRDTSGSDCPLRGIMDAGPGFFTSHNKGSLNKSKGYRRGYYGEFLMDIPDINKIRAVDENGNPLASLGIEVFQQKAGFISNTPVFVGLTDTNGYWVLLNQSAESLTTLTGYIQKDNPFGPINVVANSSVFAIRFWDGTNYEYHWLDIFDFNNQYWSGNQSEATYQLTMQNLTAGSVKALCYSNTTDTFAGKDVSWFTVVAGGSGSYIYSWSGDEGLSGSGQSVTKSYSTSGTKTATITVTSGGQQAQASCSTNIISVPNDKFRTLYYDGIGFAGQYLGQMDENQIPSPVGTLSGAINHNWGGGAVAFGKSDRITGIWKGNINFTSGLYQFNVTTDDGVRVQVGDNLLIDKWQDQVASFTSGSVALFGVTSVEVQYYENGGGAQLILGWTKITDSQAPQVSITSPTNGAILSSVAPVVATAADNLGVSKVEFYLDGNLQSTDTFPDPYSWDWDTTKSTDGSYTLSAKAYDATGNVGTSSSVSVTVNNTQPPSVPTVDIKVNGSNGPLTIVYNTIATLSWNSTNATSCTASNGWSGSKGTSDSVSTGRMTVTKTFILTCTGVGGSATDSVTVNVGKIADLNLDGAVNIRDASILVSRWSSADQTADINADGMVNIRDASILVSRWGN